MGCLGRVRAGMLPMAGFTDGLHFYAVVKISNSYNLVMLLIS